MIDWDRVDQLCAEVGADAFDEVVELFLEEVDEVVQRLKAGERNALADDLHFLKGSALNLGFRDFADLCRRDEQEILRQGSGSVDLVALTDCYCRSRTEFLDKVPTRIRAA